MELFEILGAGNTFERLLGGFGTTLYISLTSALFAVVLGCALGFAMVWKNPAARVLTKAYLEFFRLMPQLVLLFIFYYGITPALNLDISAQTSAIVVVTAWAAAEMGDLVRGAIESVPRGQIEAGRAIGLSSVQQALFVTIPVAGRSIIPASVNLITRILKTSAIVPLIGVMDVTKTGQAIVDFNRFERPNAAFWIYALIFALYFAACWLLSTLSKRLETRLK